MMWTQERARRLDELRRRSRVSHEELATAAGVHRNTIGRFLNGRGVPDDGPLDLMLARIGATRDELFRADPSEAELLEVTIYDIDVAAGPGRFLTDEAVIGRWPFPREWAERQWGRDAQLAMVRVSGDSQEPELRDGDQVVINLANRRGEGLSVVRLDDALLIKRVQREGGTLRLTSNNPGYKDVLVDLAADGDRFEVVGRALVAVKTL